MNICMRKVELRLYTTVKCLSTLPETEGVTGLTAMSTTFIYSSPCFAGAVAMIASAAAVSAVLLVIALQPHNNYFMIKSCKQYIDFQFLCSSVPKCRRAATQPVSFLWLIVWKIGLFLLCQLSVCGHFRATLAPGFEPWNSRWLSLFMFKCQWAWISAGFVMGWRLSAVCFHLGPVPATK